MGRFAVPHDLALILPAGTPELGAADAIHAIGPRGSTGGLVIVRRIMPGPNIRSVISPAPGPRLPAVRWGLPS